MFELPDNDSTMSLLFGAFIGISFVFFMLGMWQSLNFITALQCVPTTKLYELLGSMGLLGNTLHVLYVFLGLFCLAAAYICDAYLVRSRRLFLFCDHSTLPFFTPSIYRSIPL